MRTIILIELVILISALLAGAISTQDAPPCGHCKVGMGSHPFGGNTGLDFQLNSKCLRDDSPDFPPVLNWRYFHSYQLPGKARVFNPSASECKTIEEQTHLYWLDGVLVENFSPKIAMKSSTDINDFCCVPDSKDSPETPGDSMRLFLERDTNMSMRLPGGKETKLCHYRGFDMPKRGGVFVGQMVHSLATVWVCKGAPRVSKSDLDLVNDTLEVITSSKFIGSVCSDLECLKIKGFGKTKIQLPNTFESDGKITVEIYDEFGPHKETFEYTHKFHPKMDDCYFCRNYIYNPEHFSAPGWIVAGFLLLFIILLLAYFMFKGSPSRWKRTIAATKRIYVAVRSEDPDLAPENPPLRRRAIYKPPAVYAVMILLLVCTEACDDAFFSDSSCSDSTCLHSFDLTMPFGKLACLNFKASNKTVKMQLDHTRLVPQLVRQYSTSDFTQDGSTWPACSATWWCAIWGEFNYCDHSPKNHSFNYLSWKPTKDLALSGCSRQDVSGCVMNSKDCVYWSTSINHKGPWYDIYSVNGVHEQTAVAFPEYERTFALHLDQPQKFELGDLKFNIMLLKSPHQLNLMSLKFAKEEGDIWHLIRSSSERGYPQSGTVGQIQCSDLEKGFNTDNCVYDHGIVQADMKGKDLLYTWREANIKNALISFPYSVADATIVSDKEPFAMITQNDEMKLHIQISEKMDLTIKPKDCQVLTFQLSGCFLCESGATLELTTDVLGIVFLESSIPALNQFIAMSSTTRIVRFWSPQKWVKDTVRWKCGKNSGTLPLDGALIYKAPKIEGSSYKTQEFITPAAQQSAHLNLWSFWGSYGAWGYGRYIIIAIVAVASLIILAILVKVLQVIRLLY